MLDSMATTCIELSRTCTVRPRWQRSQYVQCAHDSREAFTPLCTAQTIAEKPLHHYVQCAHDSRAKKPLQCAQDIGSTIHVYMYIQLETIQQSKLTTGLQNTSSWQHETRGIWRQQRRVLQRNLSVTSRMFMQSVSTGHTVYIHIS